MIENIKKLIKLIHSGGEWRAGVRLVLEILDAILDSLPDMRDEKLPVVALPDDETAGTCELESVVAAAESGKITFPWETLIPVLMSILQRFLARRGNR